MPHSCFACGSTFKTAQGLSRHYGKCPGQLQDVFSNLLQDAVEPIQFSRKVHRIEGTSDVSEAHNHQPEDPSQPPLPAPSPPPVPSRLPLPVPDRSVYPTRSGHQRKRPQRFDDMVPSLLNPLPHMPPPIPRAVSPVQPPLPSPPLPLAEPEQIVHETEPNVFGLYRSYTTFPQKDPEDENCLDKACDSPGLAVDTELQTQRWWSGLAPTAEFTKETVYAPFQNPSIFRFMSWLLDENATKTLDGANDLVRNVILADDFDKEHFRGFNAHREARQLDGAKQENGITSAPEFLQGNIWKTGSVMLRLPKEGVEYELEDEVPTVTIEDIHYRSLCEVIMTAFKDDSACLFHYIPHRLFYKPTPESPLERVISELYNSDAFLEEHERLQKQPREPGCSLETAIASVMLWSDSTHLASFGNASLWPIYCYFGNQSKYERSKPTQYAAHHLAYIPQLPDSIVDMYEKIHGRPPRDAVMTHLKRELMHAVWELILKDGFVEDYQHGIVVRCADGVTRRLYPRIFTYSADYPEKVLLSTIRFLGGCPCPRCLVKKELIAAIGTTIDDQRRSHKRMDNHQRRFDIETACRMIFIEGRGINSAAVERVLKPMSQTPTRNAFSVCLSEFDFDYHNIFVPDLLHEIELETWKAIFTHLVRILLAHGHSCVQALNKRYRQTPTFGCGTIRKFSTNASDMKKLAGRDFEDLLQCSLPVFEGLLPEPHDRVILDLLFSLSHWHALAKLRLHTVSTLDSLKLATKIFGKDLRMFIKKTCSVYETKELPDGSTSSSTRRGFNSSTYKLHAMGDYFESIWRFGTTDGYSMQIGELEHRRVKRFYVRTNKQATFTAQIAKQQRRQCMLRKIDQHQHPLSSLGSNDDEPLMPISPREHHYISPSQKKHTDIIAWLAKYPNDPALQDFILKLKNHLLARIQNDPSDTTYPTSHQIHIGFLQNRIYSRKRVQVNYTTYDMRHSQDTINPDYHADIMVLSGEEGEIQHHYTYARVLRVFHAEVFDHNRESPCPGPKHMEFLWVRWYDIDTTYSSGFQHQRLPRLQFASGENTFGFVDPNNIIRSVHLIPAYAHGYDDMPDALGPSIAQRTSDNKDWMYYYVNIFVDRDMFMRFRGGAVGHRSTLFGVPALTEEVLGDDDDDDTVEIPEVDIRSELLDYGYVKPASDDEAEESHDEDGDGWEDGDAEQEGYGSFN